MKAHSKADDFVMISHGSIPYGFAHYGCQSSVLASMEYLTGIVQEAFMVWSLHKADKANVPIDYKHVECHIKHDDFDAEKPSRNT